MLAACSGGSSGGPSLVSADPGAYAPGTPADIRASLDKGIATDPGGPTLDEGPPDIETPEAFGRPCEDHAGCEGGWCVEGPDGTVCTIECIDRCPPGWACKAVSLAGGGELTSVCVPKRARVCASCSAAGDCGGAPLCVLPADAASPDVPGTCLLPCEGPGARCPAGFTCTSRGLLPGAEPGWVCAPDEEGACCAAATEGDERSCTRSNEHGTCSGVRVCLGAGGWGACQALIPAAEVCDGQDNDCDTEADEGLPGGCGCGDGVCAGEDAGEDAQSCPPDCAARGDGICSPGESPRLAPEDCCRGPDGSHGCGDGRCLGYGCGENPESCPADCGTSCGDGECERGENPHACPDDCRRHVCGNQVCEPGDGGPERCPSDCGPTCGNCICEGGEGFQLCPIDCGSCGDGVCSPCPMLDELAKCFSDCAGVLPPTSCGEAPDGSPCDDRDPCTHSDTCRQGTCSGSVIDGCCRDDAECEDDGDLCNGVPRCDQSELNPANWRCLHDPETVVTCAEEHDGVCATTVCEAATGDCVEKKLLDCDDGDPCTLDGCERGVGCRSAPMRCPEGQHCVGGECADVPVIEDEGSPWGLEFWSADLDHYDDPMADPSSVSLPHGVVISNPGAAPGRVRVELFRDDATAPDDVIVPAGESVPVALPRLDLDDSGIFYGSVRLLSDRPVSVVQHSPLDEGSAHSGDASTLLPVHALGKDHYVVTRPSGAEIAEIPMPYEPQRGYLAVVAVSEGATGVDIEASAPILATKEPKPTWLRSAVEATTGATSLQYQLQQGEVLVLTAESPSFAILGDLTGTRVTSDKAIAVFAAHEQAVLPCPSSPDGEHNCCADHLQEQVLPVSALAQVVVCAHSPFRGTEPDFWRVVATEDLVLDTDPAQNTSNGQRAVGLELARGEWVEIVADQDFVLYATGRVAASQMLVGYECTTRALGDPAMVQGVPVRQWRTDHIFEARSGDTERGVVLMRSTGEPILLDGEAVRASSFEAVGSSAYEVARIGVDAGVHRLTASTPFGAAVYGYSSTTAHSHVPGIGLQVCGGDPDPCLTGGCEPDESSDCDDGNKCTADSCDAGHNCVHVRLANGSSCTLPDAAGRCRDGRCVEACAYAEAADEPLGCAYYAADLNAENAAWTLIVANPDQERAAGITIRNTAGIQTQADVAAGDQQILALQQANVGGTVLGPLAVELESDLPVSVLQVNPMTTTDLFSADVSQLLPRQRLGLRHRVLSAAQSAAELRGFVTVLATAEGVTRVEVTSTAKTLAGENQGTAQQSEIPAMERGERRDFSLSRLELLHLVTAGLGEDLSGTLVVADKPVAVFSGSEAANVPRTDVCDAERGVCAYDGATACSSNAGCFQFRTCCADRLEEQVPHVTLWGNDFLATAIRPGSELKDVWRFVASEDGTTVRTSPPQAAATVLDAGDWLELESSADFRVHTDGKPLLVARYLPGPQVPGSSTQQDPEPGDPSMTYLAPTTRFRAEHVFAVPPLFATNRLHLIAPAGAAVSLDGAVVAPELFDPIASSGFGVAIVEVDHGYHQVRASRAVGVEAYGLDAYASYAFSTGP